MGRGWSSEEAVPKKEGEFPHQDSEELARYKLLRA
jgi:hypothetical protein